MIGETFKRRASDDALPAHIKVVGALGTDWLVVDAEAFSVTRALSPARLAENYNAPPEVPAAQPDEETIRGPSRDELHAALQHYRAAPPPPVAPDPDAAPSPEDIFAAAAAAAAEE